MKQDKPGTRGRPRSFDKERALDAALRVFWEKGYEGASLSDLTEAMGINRPSAYAAFGDKEALFRQVLERYENGPLAYMTAALNEPTARAAIARMTRRESPRDTPGRRAGSRARRRASPPSRASGIRWRSHG